jgi:nucleoside-diphosphate-sugar epimerase
VSDGRLVVVTGASGFIGSALCGTLAAHGWRVRALVRRPVDAAPGVEVVQIADLADAPSLPRALNGADAVVHLAARVHVMRDWDSDPAGAYRRANVEPTQALAAAAVAGGVRAFVFISSVKAVGEATRVPWTAATIPKPADAYGVSKLAAEAVVRQAGAASGMKAWILRLPLVYGPGMKGNMLGLFGLVDRGVPVPVGGFDNCRSLVYRDNVVAAIEAVLDAAGQGGTYFVSDGEDLTTAELVRRIGRALGRPARLVGVPPRLLALAGRAGDGIARVMPFPFTSAAVRRLTDSLVVDARELGDATGFVPPFSVDAGLAETAAWYRRRMARPA